MNYAGQETKELWIFGERSYEAGSLEYWTDYCKNTDKPPKLRNNEKSDLHKVFRDTNTRLFK